MLNYTSFLSKNVESFYMVTVLQISLKNGEGVKLVMNDLAALRCVANTLPSKKLAPLMTH